MGASGTPVFKHLDVTAAGETLTLAQVMNGVLIYNAGPNTVFYAVGATPPTASIGSGRNSIQAGEYAILNGVAAYKLSFKCATGETATIQSMGIPTGVCGAQTGAVIETINPAAFGSQAYSAGVPVVNGPNAVAIPLNNIGLINLDVVNAALADLVTIQQGDATDEGYLDLKIEAEVDSSGIYTTIFNIRLSVAAAGSGVGGVGVTLQLAKVTDAAGLKALGNLITNYQVTGLLTQTAGVGVMTGAMDFTNFRVQLVQGIQGAVYT